MQFSFNYSALIKTSCLVNQYDRQRVANWLRIKCCGCYGTSTNSASLVIQHAISEKTETHGSFQMDDFSLLRFGKLYMSADITV